MAADRYDISIEQGVDFRLDLTYQGADGTPIDITSWTAKSQVRLNPGYPAVIVEFSSTPASGTGIALGGAAGTVVLTATAAVTAALDFHQAVYDVVLTSSTGAKHRLVEGVVTFSRTVTV